MLDVLGDGRGVGGRVEDKEDQEGEKQHRPIFLPFTRSPSGAAAAGTGSAASVQVSSCLPEAGWNGGRRAACRAPALDPRGRAGGSGSSRDSRCPVVGCIARGLVSARRVSRAAGRADRLGCPGPGRSNRSGPPPRAIRSAGAGVGHTEIVQHGVSGISRQADQPEPDTGRLADRRCGRRGLRYRPDRYRDARGPGSAAGRLSADRCGVQPPPA